MERGNFFKAAAVSLLLAGCVEDKSAIEADRCLAGANAKLKAIPPEDREPHTIRFEGCDDLTIGGVLEEFIVGRDNLSVGVEKSIKDAKTGEVTAVDVSVRYWK